MLGATHACGMVRSLCHDWCPERAMEIRQWMYFLTSMGVMFSPARFSGGKKQQWGSPNPFLVHPCLRGGTLGFKEVCSLTARAVLEETHGVHRPLLHIN